MKSLFSPASPSTMQPATFKKGTNVQRQSGARILGLKDDVRKTLQVRKNPARLFPSAMNIHAFKLPQQVS